MFTHSAITVAGMALAMAGLWAAGLDPAFSTVMAGFFSGVWYSREVSQEEHTLGVKGTYDTLAPWRWLKWNGDFTVPVGSAWIIAFAWSFGGALYVLAYVALLSLALPLLYYVRWLDGDARAFWRRGG
jgi:hypothetical protein